MTVAPWERPLMGADSSSSSFESDMAAMQADNRFVNPKLDAHVEDARRFFQWVMDNNVRWQMFQSENQSKASILNVLVKLEDKYQVRG
jgi:hypothetical protein